MSIPEGCKTYWPMFKRAEAQTGMPAKMLSAICWRESLFGAALTPPGPAGTGDFGHGRGLMQIDDRWHKDFVAGELWKDAQANIIKGAEILHDALGFFVQRGYSGPKLWSCAISAFNAGCSAVLKAVTTEKPGDPDSPTTGRNYSRDVLSKAEMISKSAMYLEAPDDSIL